MRASDLLDLNEVLQHPGKKIRVELESSLGQEADVELLEAINGHLEVVSTGNLLLITGQFKATAVVDCARCGSPLEVPIEFEVDEQFPVEGVAACYAMNDFARVVPDEPFQIFEGNNLMVDSLLRQDLLIALPMQPLCQYGWEGPCPRFQAQKQLEEPHGRPEFQKLAQLEVKAAEPSKGKKK